MRGTVSKLMRRTAAKLSAFNRRTGRKNNPLSDLKRNWALTPRPEREALRKRYEAMVA